jgi:hypothetical protein
MATARRAYVYLLAGISLAVLLVGLTLLLGALFSWLGLGSDLYAYGSDEGRRQQLTTGAALVAVGLPVWLIHWWLAQRSVRPGRADAEIERSGALRGLYVAAVLAILLGAAAAQATDLLRSTIQAMGGDGSSAYDYAAGALAGLLVAGAAFLYHLVVRLADWRHGPIRGAGAWLPRLYLYGAVGVSLVVLLTLGADLVGLGLRVIIGPAEPDYAAPGVSWWVYPMASSLSGALVSAAIWLGHWWYAGRLVAEPSDRVDAERPARLRLAYFAGIELVLAGGALIALTAAAAALLEQAMGLGTTFGADPLALTFLTPLSAAVLFAVAWWIHRGWFSTDTAAVGRTDPQRPATAERLDAYGHALLGLAFAGTSSAWIIGIAIEGILGSRPAFGGDELLRQQLAVALPAFVLGVAVWGWAWPRAQARWRANRSLEAESAVRRAALLAVLGASVVSAIGGFGFLFYRVFGSLFGVSLSSDVASDLSRPIGVIVVSAIAGVTHGLAIRRDQALRASEQVTAEVAARLPNLGPPEAPPEPGPPRTPVAVDLHVTAPSEESVLAVLEALRGSLPDGATIEVREPPSRTD